MSVDKRRPLRVETTVADTDYETIVYAWSDVPSNMIEL